MSKKNFTKGLDSLLQTTTETETSNGSKEVEKKSKKENESRATFIINDEILTKLKGIAYWDRLLIKDVLTEALENYISTYEKKHGEIKCIPSSK